MSALNVLRDLRVARGLSQTGLATKSGAPQSLVSRLEAGERDLTPETARKIARACDVDEVRLYLAHSYETVVKAVEEGDPDGADKALALARRLLTILEESDLDEEREDELRTIIQELMKLVNTTTGEGRPVPTGKPIAPAGPVAKASADGTMAILRRMGGMSRVGGFDEDEWYDRLVEEGLPAETLERLLDEISVRHSSSLISDAERLSLEALQAAVERRIAELAPDGARSSLQYLAGDDPRSGGGFRPERSDVAAVKARRSAEAQEARDQSDCYDELGLDSYGRPVPQAKKDHDAALKSASFLSQSERETGTDLRGRPLNERELKRRRYIETGEE